MRNVAIAQLAVMVAIFLFAAPSDLLSASSVRISGDLSIYRLEPNTRYLVDEDLVIPPGKNVHLPSGVVLLFSDNTGLTVHGSFSAGGTDSSLIIFTSMNDTSYNRKAKDLATPFSWTGIRISDTAETVVLRNVLIQYANSPLVSEASDIRLEQIRRARTMQPYFSINGRKMEVNAMQPFYFPPPPPPEQKEDGLVNVSRDEPKFPEDAIPNSDSPPWWKSRGTRLTLTGVGAATLCAGAAFLINSAVTNSQYEQSWADYHDNQLSFDTRRVARDDAMGHADSRDKSLLGGGILGAVGVVFLGGLGLTFVF